MQYLIANGPMQTTAAFAKVTTGNVIKTMMQVKPIIPMRIVEWGFSFDGSAAATPGQVELIETDVAATITAYATADLTRLDAEALQFGDPTAILMAITSTNTSGYTATVEGSITSVRNLAGPQLVAPTNQFLYQFPLGYRAYVQANKFVRIRMTFGTAISAYAYLVVEF